MADFSDILKQLQDNKKSQDKTTDAIEGLKESTAKNLEISSEDLKVSKKINEQSEKDKISKRSTPASSLIERAKEQNTYLKGLFSKFLGPTSGLGKKISGLASFAGNFTSKKISTLWGAIKTGAFVVAMGALIAFLDSKQWKKWETELIPKLQEGIVNTFKAIERIFEAFFGKAGVGPRGYGAKQGSFLGGINQILFEVFGKNSRITIALKSLGTFLTGSFEGFGDSMKRIFTAFFGKSGVGPRGYGAKSGSFLGGLNQIFIELFGENNRVLWAFKQIGKWIGKFVDGLLDVVTLIKGEDAEGNKIDRWEVFRENWKEMIAAIAVVGTALAPRLMFGTLMIAGKLAWKAGKGISQWLFFKAMKAAFLGLL